MTRSQLMTHCKNFASGKTAIDLVCRTECAVKLFKEYKSVGVYSRHGQLAKKRIVGIFIRQDRMQRRRVNRYTPAKPVGRPRKDENRVLISYLAAAFTRATGLRVTLNREGTGASTFEAFVTPILKDVGVRDVRRTIANHLKARPQ